MDFCQQRICSVIIASVRHIVAAVVAVKEYHKYNIIERLEKNARMTMISYMFFLYKKLKSGFVL